MEKRVKWKKYQPVPGISISLFILVSGHVQNLKREKQFNHFSHALHVPAHILVSVLTRVGIH